MDQRVLSQDADYETTFGAYHEIKEHFAKRFQQIDQELINSEQAVPPSQIQR